MEYKTTLKTPIRYLKGVGPERDKVLSKLGLRTLADLFYFFPRRYEDRSHLKKIRELVPGEKECVRGIVSSRSLIRTKHGQSILKIVLTDAMTPLFASWFNQPYLSKVLLPNREVVLYGKVEKEGKHFHMIHPEYEIITDTAKPLLVHSGRIVPVYPLTEDLSQKGIRLFLFRVTQDWTGLLGDFLESSMKQRLGLAERGTSFQQVHFPNSFKDLEMATRRLVFDEFFMMQLTIQMKKAALQKEDKNISHKSGEEEVRRFIQSLDFDLTPGQANATQDIVSDMKKGRPMNRLVQGEVGSGKTVVAAAGLVFTVANGFQGALMAPTEILAQQHYFNLTQLLEPLGVTCGYLAQGVSEEEKESLLSRTASGELQVLIGTHALIQECVKFKKLGLAVIDEQHKFGVFQRGRLREKAETSAHFLLMTATPIPRTLAMTLFGDLDISVISELPKGRQPITTFWAAEEKRAEIYSFLDTLLEKGRQAYVVCPWIETEETRAVKSVSTIYEEITKHFPQRRVGILHGRIKSDEKRKIMKDFKDGRVDILVSTVVIEVGVDVPNASVMLIENAEKFGLAQLHQLRGRVGRGSEASFCILFSDTQNEESVERLNAFVETESGFHIAEQDLKLRGAGDILGDRQHGVPKLRIGDLIKDIEILEKARREAKALVEKDPQLERYENRLLRRALAERFKFSFEKSAVLA